MECIERCERLHPHCTLTLTRDIAPDKNWHWHVTMPDGHLYDISHGPLSFELALADMQARGVTRLMPQTRSGARATRQPTDAHRSSQSEY